ncbi:MAG: thiamine pyrophosphate-dependent enzyme [Parcubacteria group bacterium]
MKKMNEKLDTLETNTWCPGCLNFTTLAVLKKLLGRLHAEEKIKLNSVVLVTDIGCGAKIYDYINVNTVYALHGRVLPVATGIKAARPELTVIGFSGDGGAYDEGMNHLIHSAKRNVGVTMVVANNGVFALTKGQPTATNSKSSGGPIDAIRLANDAGATFANRASALDLEFLERVLEKALVHKGFSLVEIIQPCLIFKNNMEEIRKETERIRKTGISEGEKRITWEDEIRTHIASRKN